MTTTPLGTDPSDPIYTIQHIAALLHVSVDTAREYTSRASFPASRQPGARLLWLREDVLAWVRELPTRTADERRRTARVAAAVATIPQKPCGTQHTRRAKVSSS